MVKSVKFKKFNYSFKFFVYMVIDNSALLIVKFSLKIWLLIKNSVF